MGKAVGVFQKTIGQSDSTEDSEPLAWQVWHTYGPFGSLFTREPYRGKGLAKLCMKACVEVLSIFWNLKSKITILILFRNVIGLAILPSLTSRTGMRPRSDSLRNSDLKRSSPHFGSVVILSYQTRPKIHMLDPSGKIRLEKRLKGT